jgi:hypothetical protein
VTGIIDERLREDVLKLDLSARADCTISRLSQQRIKLGLVHLYITVFELRSTRDSAQPTFACGQKCTAIATVALRLVEHAPHSAKLYIILEEA